MKALSLRKTLMLGALVAFAACGDDDDGALPPSIDAGTVCPIEAPITDVPTEGTTGNAVIRFTKAGGGTQVVWSFAVDGGKDMLQLTVDDPVPLDTPLPLDAACVANGGYCWALFSDYTVVNNMVASDFFYYPDSGTLTITEAGETGTGRFKATLTAAAFSHYDSTGAPVDDGCGATTPAFTVDMPITAPSGKPGAGAPLAPRPARITR